MISISRYNSEVKDHSVVIRSKQQKKKTKKKEKEKERKPLSESL